MPNGATLRAELARKSIHVASSVIPLAYAYGVERRSMLLVLGALAVSALAIEATRLRSRRAHAAFTRAVGPLLREHEHTAWSGASWLLAAYAFSVLLFPRPIAVAAMLAAGLGDAAAAVVGRGYAAWRARNGVPIAGKTLAGSVACAAVTFAAAWGVAGLPPVVAAFAALAASGAERVDVPAIDDNVRVALAAGAIAWALTRLAAVAPAT